MHSYKNIFVFSYSSIDFSNSAAMMSLRRIKSFVFARIASPTREFSARLAVQKQIQILLRVNMAAE